MMTTLQPKFKGKSTEIYYKYDNKILINDKNRVGRFHE